MNFLTGLVLILLVFAKTDSFSTPTITGFFEGCPYQGEDMLMEGDTFYKINGERIYFSSDVATYIQRGGGETSDIVIIRDGKKIYLDDFPLQQVEYETDSGTVMKYGLYFQKTESVPAGNHACGEEFARAPPTPWRHCHPPDAK